MHTSFTGSTKRTRQVNLQGRASLNNVWGKSLGSTSALVHAQAEREKRALDRKRLIAAKNIQRIWRGHSTRAKKREEWRTRWDTNRPQDLVDQFRLLLQFFDVWTLADHRRLLEFSKNLEHSLESQNLKTLGDWLEKLGIALAKALMVCDQVALIPHTTDEIIASRASRKYRTGRHAPSAEDTLDDDQWAAFCQVTLNEYMSRLLNITRSSPRSTQYIFAIFSALSRLKRWAVRNLPNIIQEMIAKIALLALGVDNQPTTQPVYPNLEAYARLAEFLTTQELYRQMHALEILSTFVNLDWLAQSIISKLESNPDWLSPTAATSLLSYFSWSQMHRGSPDTKSITTIFAITTLLSLSEPESVDNRWAGPESIDQMLAEIAALSLDAPTTARVITKYAMGLLRAFPSRAYDIRMRIFLNSSVTTAARTTLTSIQYFWPAAQNTEIFQLIAQSQKNVLPLLRNDTQSETEQIGRPSLRAKRQSQSWKDDWRLILFFLEMYTSALKLMDDEEFFATDIQTSNPSTDLSPEKHRYQSSLPLSDVSQMITFLKHLSYTLYWNAVELNTLSRNSNELSAHLGSSTLPTLDRGSHGLPGLGTVTYSYLKSLTTGVMRMLHERDSRRQFLPEGSWLMTSQVDMSSFIPEVVHEEEKRLEFGDLEDEEESDDELNETNGHTVPSWTTRFSARSRNYGNLGATQPDIVNRFVRRQEKMHKRNQLAAVAPRLELLRNLPFFIPFETRVNIFRQFVFNDQFRRRHGAVDPHHWRMNVEHRESRGSISGRNVLQQHTAKIRRESVFEDAMDQFYPLGESFKEPIYIKFFDKQGIEEQGIDGGGVTKEFLTSITSQAIVPSAVGKSWFVENEQHYVHPNSDLHEAVIEVLRHKGLSARSPQTQESLRNLKKEFEFIGRVIGKCLYEGILIDVRFAGFFLLKWALTGGTTSATNETAYRPTLNDMREFDSDVYRHLLTLKDWTGNVEEDFGLNFTITDSFVIDEQGTTVSKTRELVPNGANTMVTNGNRLVYIDRYVRYRLQGHPKFATDAFLSGLGQIIQPMWLAMFNQKELQWLVGGDDSELDLADLRRNTDLSGIYQRGDDPQDHPTIELFWTVLKEMDDKDRREVLRFVTSTPRAPLLGFSHLNPRFCIRDSMDDVGRHDLNRLPTSSTCVNQLKLPPYKSKTQMREKLLYAAKSGAGFDLS